MLQFEIPGKENFRVAYNSDEDGGGTWFGQEYVSIVQQRYGRGFDRCLEWCSGPGFIGFSLLAHSLCEHLCLMDKHLPVAESIRQTTSANLCSDRVDFYCLDNVADIPQHEIFDLIVANPPHYLQCPGDSNYQRIAVDTEWQAHREFFANIGKHMHEHSIILLQENHAGSLDGPNEFFGMIDRNGLKVTGYWTSPQHFDRSGPTQIYYLEIRQK